jgi:hypothetical protein
VLIIIGDSRDQEERNREKIFKTRRSSREDRTWRERDQRMRE